MTYREECPDIVITEHTPDGQIPAKQQVQVISLAVRMILLLIYRLTDHKIATSKPLLCAYASDVKSSEAHQALVPAKYAALPLRTKFCPCVFTKPGTVSILAEALDWVPAMLTLGLSAGAILAPSTVAL